MSARRGPKVDPLLGPLTRKTVLLDELSITMLGVIGEGNLSHGVRVAARAGYAGYQTGQPVSKAAPRQMMLTNEQREALAVVLAHYGSDPRVRPLRDLRDKAP